MGGTAAASSNRPTAARTGRELTADCRRTASSTRSWRSRRATPSASTRRAPPPATHRHLPLGRCRRDWRAAERHRRTSIEASTAAHGRSQEPRRADRHRATSPTSEDGGKTWVPFKGAPGGDDYQYAWINPNNPTSSCRRDQGAVVSLERGGPGAPGTTSPPRDVPHHDRQRVPVSRLRRPAGQRLGVRRQPRQRRRDHVPRVASRRRRGIRLRRARSARPRHRLWQQGDALRPADRPGVERRPVEGGRGGRPAPGTPSYRKVRTQPLVFSMVDKQVAVLRHQRAVENDGRRHHLEADQPRPDAQDARACRRASASTRAGSDAKQADRGAASSTPSARPTWTSTASGSAPTTA